VEAWRAAPAAGEPTAPLRTHERGGSIAATLFGYDEFILRQISPETLLASTPRH
jgi:hypothetical protein